MLKHMLGFLLITCAASLSTSLCAARPLTPEDAASLPQAELVANLADSHPVVLYAYAKRLFAEGKRDEAVTWFYAGQLRFRFHLAANPSLPRDGEPALMASLNATLGRTLNEWAGGSPKDWADSIDKALAWDAENRNATTSKEAHSKVLNDTRQSFASLRDKIVESAASIRRDREKNGLENR